MQTHRKVSPSRLMRRRARRVRTHRAPRASCDADAVRAASSRIARRAMRARRARRATSMLTCSLLADAAVCSPTPRRRPSSDVMSDVYHLLLRKMHVHMRREMPGMTEAAVNSVMQRMTPLLQLMAAAFQTKLEGMGHEFTEKLVKYESTLAEMTTKLDGSLAEMQRQAQAQAASPAPVRIAFDMSILCDSPSCWMEMELTNEELEALGVSPVRKSLFADAGSASTEPDSSSDNSPPSKRARID